MTLLGAIKLFTIGIFLAISIGLLIRSYQENIHPLLWYLVIVLFLVNFFVDLIIPWIVAVRILLGKSKSKYNWLDRIFTGLIIAVPVGYFLMITKNETFNDEKFWNPFRKLSINIRENRSRYYEFNKVKLTKTELKKQSTAAVNMVEMKLKELRAY
jgi:Na+-driven multidrug efflux pump